MTNFSPVNNVEMGMVEEMASAYWRIRRNWAIETYLLETALAAQPPGEELPRIAAAHAEISAQPQLAQLRREETRLHVMYQRALYNLLMLRTSKNRSEPKKPSVCNISRGSADPNEPKEPKVA